METLLLYLLLSFPLVFSLGLLPQVSTFCIYALEQIDLHVFGGTAVTGLASAAYVLARSLFLVALLFGPALAGLREPAQVLPTVSLLFFCGVPLLDLIHVDLTNPCSALDHPFFSSRHCSTTK